MFYLNKFSLSIKPYNNNVGHEFELEKKNHFPIKKII